MREKLKVTTYVCLTCLGLSQPVERPPYLDVLYANSVQGDLPSDQSQELANLENRRTKQTKTNNNQQPTETQIVSVFNSKSFPQQLKARWENAYDAPITYKLNYNEFMPKGYSRSENINNLRSIIRQAFKVWEESGDLRFMEVSESEYAEINVSFQQGKHQYQNRDDQNLDCLEFDGPARPGWSNQLAHAYYPGRRHYDQWYYPQDIRGDLHFDSDENWIYTAKTENHEDSAQNIFATAIHELGHSLGLDHNPENSEAIMYPMINHKWQTAEAHLNADDIAQVRALYGHRRNWFYRNWIFLSLCGGLIFIFLLYELLRKKNVISTNENWKSVRIPRGRDVPEAVKKAKSSRLEEINRDFDNQPKPQPPKRNYQPAVPHKSSPAFAPVNNFNQNRNLYHQNNNQQPLLQDTTGSKFSQPVQPQSNFNPYGAYTQNHSRENQNYNNSAASSVVKDTTTSKWAR